jgi:hypothetical protein
MSIDTLVDKVVKGAIAKAIEMTETVEEVGQRIARNAIEAALTRPKRMREEMQVSLNPRPRLKKQRNAGTSFKKLFEFFPGTEQTKKYLKTYAVLRKGGPIDSAGYLVSLPLEMIQYIFSFINPKVRGRWRLALSTWRPMDTDMQKRTWFEKYQRDPLMRGVFGYNEIRNDGEEPFRARRMYHSAPSVTDRWPRRWPFFVGLNEVDSVMVWPQYDRGPDVNNARRINWFGSATDYQEPTEMNRGSSWRNRTMFDTL